MLVLRNATILDGTGNAPYVGSILVCDKEIAAIGSFEEPSGARIVDLQGLVAAPGFVDLHSHSDLKLKENRREKLNQGVTTEVVGNCGFSPFPSGPYQTMLSEQNDGILNGKETWPNAAEYLTNLHANCTVAHPEVLVGHGSLRTAVCGTHTGPAKEDQISRMEAVLDEALAQGACGFSTGLMYAPGSAATEQELLRLCRVVAGHGKLYTTHMRSYSWLLNEAIEEQINLARKAQCRLQISHLQAVGQRNWHKQDAALKQIEDARAEGIDVAFDSYPYLAGSTVMTQLLPQSSLDQGTDGLMRCLQASSERHKLESYLREETAQKWSDIFVSSLESTANQALIGKNLEEIASDRGCTPESLLLDLLLEEKGKVNIVAFNQSEENLRQLLTHPLCSIISDGFYVKDRPHPRLYGTFPLLLGEICREKRWLTLPEAIHKITVGAARRIGLTRRGQLKQGYFADITVFDPDRIGTSASYQNPAVTPQGIELVLLEGRLIAGSFDVSRHTSAAEHIYLKNELNFASIGEPSHGD
ncbi:N-acyl-D-amino-acid deacylase family protein [Edaphobacter flagellatus]|uniref:N-acyl-D-amino-acid deacylase family protein n=1 Tax=Edaphobacter flagellatus TaxID=1933044 RepID=UPI0021B1F0CC|nr:D-aminoacylase [Edaphobacter flagellatus]